MYSIYIKLNTILIYNSKTYRGAQYLMGSIMFVHIFPACVMFAKPLLSSLSTAKTHGHDAPMWSSSIARLLRSGLLVDSSAVGSVLDVNSH